MSFFLEEEVAWGHPSVDLSDVFTWRLSPGPYDFVIRSPDPE